MNRNLGLFMTIFILVVAGCSNKPVTIENSPTVSPTTVLTSSSIVSPTQSPVPTMITVTSTPSLIPSETPAPKTGITQNCLAIQPNPPENNLFTGSIVFDTFGHEVPDSISFYDLQTRKISGLPGNNNHSVSVAPDSTMWAFKNMAANRVEIHSSTSKLIKSIPMGKYWGSFAGWLDNQNLIIVMEEPDLANYTPQPYILAHVKYPRAVQVINPFTGKIQSLASNYPNIDGANTGARWDLFGTTIYDPTLSRVVYPGQWGNKAGERGYILYDIPAKKILAEIPNLFWNNYAPRWSPDGSGFIVMGSDELYLVSSGGNVAKITHMNPLFDPLTGKGRNYAGIYYDWSPDGKQVAMWLREDFKNQPALAILNTETSMITNTCILAGFDPNRPQNLPYPVWSPDGKYLVVSANYQADQNTQGHYDVVLVDLEKQAAFKITSNMFPVGWLISQ